MTRALFEPDIFSLSTEDEISGPVNISEELEQPTGEIGEIIISGWHVNTYQVSGILVRLVPRPSAWGGMI